jgi:hypothetical protein
MKSLSSSLAALVLLSGCSVLDNLATAPKYDPYTLYLGNGTPVRARSDILDRYACRSGAPLVCQCWGGLNAFCECVC